MRTGVRQRIERVLFGAGFACLAVFLWTAGERVWFQSRYLHELREESTVTPARFNLEALRAGPLGRIEIPRAHVNAAILDGVDAGTLDRAVGHVPGTAYPGEIGGRVALAAHRDSFFSSLGSLRRGDVIVLEVGRQKREYRVASTSIVKADRMEVLTPTSDSVVTLITCYPFHYLGGAPQRFVVNAMLAREVTL